MSDEIIPITRPSSAGPTPQAPVVKNETKYPTEIVELPSKGYFYAPDDPLSKGSVELKMMTAKEEDILTNESFIKKGIVLDRLLESLIVDKSIKIDNLLTGDKNALFIAARRLAYGDSYGPVEVTCNSCREKCDVTIDLSEIKTKEYDFSTKQKGLNFFEFVLPYSKRVLKVKILSNKDDVEIENELKGLAKIGKSSSEVTTRLKHLIVSVDGNNDKAYVRQFVDGELLSRDSIELRKFIRSMSPDIDLNFNFTCEHCQAEERVGVPMTVQFFWPESGV
jgi:hypothetical protein